MKQSKVELPPISHVRIIPQQTIVQYRPACVVGVCEEGFPNPAEYLLAQVDDTEPAGYVWVQVCSMHMEGWWDEEPDPSLPERPKGYSLVPLR